jgi:hypothetical protein
MSKLGIEIVDGIARIPLLDMTEVKNAIVDLIDEHMDTIVGSKVKSLLLKDSYFDDPASSRFHLARKGGLALHSLLVLDSLIRLRNAFVMLPKVSEISLESMMKVALLHDMCKVGTYKVESRNRKNEKTEKWEKYDVYVRKSAGPGTNYGHGFGSLLIAMEAGIEFDAMEKEAIIHHMGAFGETKDTGLNDAMGTNPLAFLLHQADMTATHLIETEIE